MHEQCPRGSIIRHQDIRGKPAGKRYGGIAAGRISSGCPPACFSPRFLPLRVNHRLKRGKNQRECAARPTQSESECRSQDPPFDGPTIGGRSPATVRCPRYGNHRDATACLASNYRYRAPAVRPEASEDLVRKFFLVLLFAILRSGGRQAGRIRAITVRFPTDIPH